MKKIINVLVNNIELILTIAGIVATSLLIYANVVGFIMLARVSGGAVMFIMLSLIDLLYIGG